MLSTRIYLWGKQEQIWNKNTEDKNNSGEMSEKAFLFNNNDWNWITEWKGIIEIQKLKRNFAKENYRLLYL